MARLNVDYRKVRSDPRFRALGRRIGGEGNAWEMILRFWDIAQEYWGREQLVPLKVFDLEGDLEVLLEVDLAERRDDGVYAKGSEEAFGWYLAKCQASRKGVEARRGGGSKRGEGGVDEEAVTGSKQPIGQPIGQASGQPIGQPALVNPPTLTPAPALAPVISPKGGELELSTDERPRINARRHNAQVRPSTFSSSDLTVGSEWLTLAVTEMPWREGKPGMTAEAFAEAIAKLRRVTGLNDEGIVALLDFVKGDDFWRKNALSPGGLLKKSERNGQRKIDNILVRMKAEANKGSRGIAAAAKEWAEQ